MFKLYNVPVLLIFSIVSISSLASSPFVLRSIRLLKIMSEMKITTKMRKEWKLSKYLKATVRMLMKARDSYIRSMSECSDKVAYGTVMGCPTGQVHTGLPKSYSVNSTKSSNDEDMRELIRVASTRSLGNRIQADVLRRQQIMRQSPTSGKNNMPRSYSVGIGRIDEDKTCDFGDDPVQLKTGNNLFMRSRSYAVAKRPGL